MDDWLNLDDGVVVVVVCGCVCACRLLGVSALSMAHMRHSSLGRLRATTVVIQHTDSKVYSISRRDFASLSTAREIDTVAWFAQLKLSLRPRSSVLRRCRQCMAVLCGGGVVLESAL